MNTTEVVAEMRPEKNGCLVSLSILTCLYFDLPYELVKIRRNSQRYSVILHTKTSGKMYIYIYIISSVVHAF